MMVKAANTAWQLHIQEIELFWTKDHQYLGVWVNRRLSFTPHAA